MWKNVKTRWETRVSEKAKMLTPCGKILKGNLSTENKQQFPQNVEFPDRGEGYFFEFIFAVMSFTVWANWESFFVMSSIFLMDEMTVV